MKSVLGADVLAAILTAAFLQDLSYTSKTVLVSRGRRTLAVAADVCAMVASSIYLILAASVTIRSGLSVATVEAFVAIAAGGAGGTVAGMVAANSLERLFIHARSISEEAVDEAGWRSSEHHPMVTVEKLGARKQAELRAEARQITLRTALARESRTKEHQPTIRTLGALGRLASRGATLVWNVSHPRHAAASVSSGRVLRLARASRPQE